MTLRLCLLFLLLPTLLSAQKSSKYWIELTDKNDSPYCVCRPAEFLSARSIERRVKGGVEVVENDLPVNPGYVNALKTIGLQIHGTSKWLNAVSVITDSNTVKKAYSLPFVKRIQYLGPHLKLRNPPNRPAKQRVPIPDYPKPGGTTQPMGYSGLQNSLLDIQPLHAAGYRGKNIWIAVMDGGFVNADTIPLFDSVAIQGRLIQGWDFVERDASVFEEANHGTSVLSVMAANLPGYFVGEAPEATYFLIKTEDTGGEFPIEEANWVSGAEWADSVGVDLINASLGYTSFNDTTLGHFYRELDGKSTIGARGATIAATKGMIVCNAAGNEGDGPWHYIGVPADASGIISVGAVSHNGRRASFSSFGPTADGRIKPDLVAPGEDIVVAGNVGINLGVSSGTSLASPMLTGAFAALWSAYPEKTDKEILEAVFHTADQFDNPDNARGWGLPNFTLAWLDLGGYEQQQSVYAYDRLQGSLSLLFSEGNYKNGDAVDIRNLLGERQDFKQAAFTQKEINKLTINGLESLNAGCYSVKITGAGHTDTFLVAIGK